MSRLAHLAPPGSENIKDPKIRGEYQKHLFATVKPVLEAESRYDLRNVEDCLASGETIAGGLIALEEKTQIETGGRIRADVAVATTQGILVLREFTQQNHLKLELNVGCLAYGLPAGAEVEGTEARAHANYITYPPELLNQLSPAIQEQLESYTDPQDGNIYVVGDMGDFGMSMPSVYDQECPWNSFRIDSHGDRNPQMVKIPFFFNKRKPTIVYFANGGWPMKAMAGLALVNIDANQIVFDARRVWAEEEEFGYGVLIDKIHQELLIYS